jgi:hypothetical protein
MSGHFKTRTLLANTPQAVIKNTYNSFSVVTVNFCNTGATSARISLAVSTSQSSPNIGEYLDYQILIQPFGVYERLSIMYSPGQYIVVTSTSANVVCQAWGIGLDYDVIANDIVTQGAVVPALGSFTTPARMNGSTANALMSAVAVNSSGLFVAVGSQFSSAVYATSANGTTWTTPQRMATAALDYSITPSVAVNSSGRFVAVGLGGDGAIFTEYGYSATSTNGTTWTEPTAMNGALGYASMNGVAVNSSGLFVAVGTKQDGTTIYATSANGTAWSTPAIMNGASTFELLLGITVNSSGLFVAVGNTQSGYPLYRTSTNGTTWSAPAFMNGSTVPAYMNGIAVNSSGLFVAVGENSINHPVYATSTNGTTWTTPALMNGSTVPARMKSVTVDSYGRFVAVGFNTSTEAAVYATSTNGTTWTTPALMNSSTATAYMNGVAVSATGRFVAVGWDSSNAPVFATATTS